MNEVRQIQKQYCSQAMLLAVGVALIFLAAGAKPISKGLILGALFSNLNFILIGQGLHFQLNKGRYRTFLVCMGSIWLRYALLAIPLVMAVKLEMFNFFAAAVGIFMVQLVILGHHLGGMLLPLRQGR
jgi:hypothetical protein